MNPTLRVASRLQGFLLRLCRRWPCGAWNDLSAWTPRAEGWDFGCGWDCKTVIDVQGFSRILNDFQRFWRIFIESIVDLKTFEAFHGDLRMISGFVDQTDGRKTGFPCVNRPPLWFSVEVIDSEVSTWWILAWKSSRTKRSLRGCSENFIDDIFSEV